MTQLKYQNKFECSNIGFRDVYKVIINKNSEHKNVSETGLQLTVGTWNNTIMHY